MPCVDLTTSSLITPLMTSKVLSIGPPEGGGDIDDDGGLKAGVAPGNQKQQVTSVELLSVSRRCRKTLDWIKSTLCGTL